MIGIGEIVSHLANLWQRKQGGRKALSVNFTVPGRTSIGRSREYKLFSLELTGEQLFWLKVIMNEERTRLIRHGCHAALEDYFDDLNKRIQSLIYEEERP